MIDSGRMNGPAQPDKAVEGERPITADFSAKMLETYAGMILDLADHGAAPGKTGPGWLNLFETTNLTLTSNSRSGVFPLKRRGSWSPISHIHRA